MKIKLSQYTPRKTKETIIITEVSIHIRITLENIYLAFDALHVMRKDTSTNSIPETKVALTRRRETREDIIIILQRMMNLP